jgi:hypothetical protein
MKKLGLIILVVIMALGALGVGYAAWNGTILANATVTTGYASAAFDGSYNQSLTYGNSTVVTTAGGNGSYLTITVTNAYPGQVFAGIPFVVWNNGTVPMKIKDVTLPVDPQWNGGWVVQSFTGTAPAGTVPVNADSTYGTITFGLNPDPLVIVSPGSYSFTVNVNYEVVPGPGS